MKTLLSSLFFILVVTIFLAGVVEARRLPLDSIRHPHKKNSRRVSSSPSSSTSIPTFSSDAPCQNGGGRIINVACDPTVGGELIKVRDYIRTLQPLNETIFVNTTGTCVSTNHSTPVLELDGNLDGVSANSFCTVTWYGGKIRGGVQIPYSAWQQSNKVPGALMVNLTQFGITSFDQIGSYQPGGLGQCNGNRAELFLSGKPMILARAPNVYSSNGPWMNWNRISEFTNETSFSSMNQGAASGLPSLVGQTWSEQNSVYSHGYWSFDWADSWVRIENVTSSASGQYKLAVDPSTPPVYGFQKGARFYISNHISLLDSTMEYYIDDDLVLHFIAPSGLPNLEAWISLNSNSLIAQVENGATLNGVGIQGIDIRYGRDSGVSMSSINNGTLVSCNVTSFSKNGVSFNGYSNFISGNTISETGCSGISIEGGDAKTLAYSSNDVDNNTISYMGRITRSYKPGIQYGGVGHAIFNNTIYQGPHAGILGGGNNMYFSQNTLHDLIFGSRDSGAFYTGRSWVHRGNYLTNNTFYNIRTIEPTYAGSTLVVAMYFDDEQSGMTATGNTCVQVDGCFLLGGGRDNTISDNICKSTDQYCVHFDNRGMNWQRAYCTPPNGQLVEQLFQVNYTYPPYSKQYPRIVNTLSDRPCVPVGNLISNNLYSNCTKGFVSESTATIESWGSTIENNSQI